MVFQSGYKLFECGLWAVSPSVASLIPPESRLEYGGRMSRSMIRRDDRTHGEIYEVIICEGGCQERELDSR